MQLFTRRWWLFATPGKTEGLLFYIIKHINMYDGGHRFLAAFPGTLELTKNSGLTNKCNDKSKNITFNIIVIFWIFLPYKDLVLQ